MQSIKFKVLLPQNCRCTSRVHIQAHHVRGCCCNSKISTACCYMQVLISQKGTFWKKPGRMVLTWRYHTFPCAHFSVTQSPNVTVDNCVLLHWIMLGGGWMPLGKNWPLSSQFGAIQIFLLFLSPSLVLNKMQEEKSVVKEVVSYFFLVASTRLLQVHQGGDFISLENALCQV